MNLVSIIIAILAFSVLVLIHEFGHFLLAKKNGICVMEFSLGMGPRLFSFVKGETRYSLKAIPFGGSCAMLGDGFVEEGDYDEERSFEKKGVWARISVIAAGPIFNFLLAWVLAIIVIGAVGIDKPVVEGLEKDSPAYEAGLRDGDLITKYNGSGITISREIWLQDYTNPLGDDAFEVTVKRDGEKKTFTITPQEKTKYMLGLSYSANEDPAEFTVMEGGALEAAGFQDGDVVTRIDGTDITSGKAFAEYTTAHPLEDKTISLTVDRNGETITKDVTPQSTDYTYTGFSYRMYREKTGSLETIGYSFGELKYQIKSVFKSLGMLVTGRLSKDDVGGPVRVVDLISDTVNETKSEGTWITLLTILNLIILLSANLGVMNLLPLPALDGGRLVFLFLELVRGKPVPKEKEGMVHMVGMIFLMILMVFILFNDISNVFK